MMTVDKTISKIINIIDKFDDDEITTIMENLNDEFS